MKAAVHAAVLLLMPQAVLAQSASPHDQIFDLATIQAAHDVCGFELTDEQQDIMDQRRQALMDKDGISAEEIASVTAQVGASLHLQVAEGVCKPASAEAQLYKRKLAEYGLL